jgi:YfiH family protein
MIQAPTLAELDGVQHRFFTRRGGVSAGLYSSLNCGYGSGDAPENVRENRRRVAGQFGLGETDLLTVHQIHSTDVLTVAQDRWTSPGAPKADALVTDRPGVVLGVLAADCAPVLLADARAGVIGAAHAGWKGALNGVVETTIAAMERLGARRENLHAAIGPCIGRDSYEVGPEFPAPFLAQDDGNAAFFRAAPRAGHFLFDLAGYLRARTARAGVAATATGHDTLAATEDFFSYRRNTLSGVRDYGRGLSAIAFGR